MARLNQEQLDRLRTALQRKGIAYQELEDELLDHVASEVEAEMAEGESFYSATKKAFIRFDRNELSKIQGAFMRTVYKNGFQLAWRQYRSYWTSWKVLPNIAIVGGLMLLNRWPVFALDMGTIWALTWGLLFVTSMGTYWWFRQSITARSAWDAGHQLFSCNFYFNLLLLIVIDHSLIPILPPVFPIFIYLTLFSHLSFLESLKTLKIKGLQLNSPTTASF